MCSNDFGASVGKVSTVMTPLAVSMRKTGAAPTFAGVGGFGAAAAAFAGAVAGFGAWAATGAHSASAQRRTGA